MGHYSTTSNTSNDVARDAHDSSNNDNQTTQLLVRTRTLEVMVDGHDDPDVSTTTTTADDKSTTIVNHEPHDRRSPHFLRGQAEATTS